jgi:mannonate dehydratase
MNRRAFLTSAGALTVASRLAPGRDPSEESPQPARAHLRVGTQFGSGPSGETLRVVAALGVNHICCGLPSPRWDENWSVTGLLRLREKVESSGIKLEMVPLPLSSRYITRSENPHIMLGKSPDRDREIDQICEMIRNVARAGIPAVKYNLTILGVVRTEPTPGRGGARYSTFVYEKAKQDPPLTEV